MCHAIALAQTDSTPRPARIPWLILFRGESFNQGSWNTHTAGAPVEVLDFRRQRCEPARQPAARHRLAAIAFLSFRTEGLIVPN